MIHLCCKFLSDAIHFVPASLANGEYMLTFWGFRTENEKSILTTPKGERIVQSKEEGEGFLSTLGSANPSDKECNEWIMARQDLLASALPGTLNRILHPANAAAKPQARPNQGKRTPNTSLDNGKPQQIPTRTKSGAQRGGRGR